MINWKSLKAQGKIKLKLKMCNIFLVLQHFFFEILIPSTSTILTSHYAQESPKSRTNNSLI